MDIAPRGGADAADDAPPQGDVLVLGLGNRRMTADALGDGWSAASSSRGTMQEGTPAERVRRCAGGAGHHRRGDGGAGAGAGGAREAIRRDCGGRARSDGNGAHRHDDSADRHRHPPRRGVGNHRKGITAETMHVPVIAVGIPLVVYASTIVRDALADMMQRESGDAQALAEQLTSGYPRDFVVTPRNIDELVAGLADLLALAINSALQTNLEMEELSHCLH